MTDMREETCMTYAKFKNQQNSSLVLEIRMVGTFIEEKSGNWEKVWGMVRDAENTLFLDPDGVFVAKIVWAIQPSCVLLCLYMYITSPRKDY